MEYKFYHSSGNRVCDLNYDLYPLINNFSFYDMTLLKNNKDTRIDDYGAFFVITDNQYIIGYTSNFGMGTHDSSFARVQKELEGGGSINNLHDSKLLSDKCINNNICGRIYYSKEINEDTYKYVGHICIDLTHSSISYDKLNVFKMMYDKYNEELLYLEKKNNPFIVEYIYLCGSSILRNESYNLESMYTYLENNVCKCNNINSEIIIGQSLKKITK